MKKNYSLQIILSLLLYSGCLTTEFKEITLHLENKGSGHGEIIYKNILSQKYADEDTPQKDFDELLNQYYYGTFIEDEFPELKITSKKLFLENDQLNGKVEFEFQNLTDIKFFQFNAESPIMYYIKGVDETFVESNGFYKEEIMPVVFWEKSEKHITLKTSISGEVNKENGDFISLKNLFLEWEAANKK